MPNFKQSPWMARDSHRLNLPHGVGHFFKQKSTITLYFIAQAAHIFDELVSGLISMAMKGGEA